MRVEAAQAPRDPRMSRAVGLRGGRIMAPQDAYIPGPGTCKCALTFHGKGDLQMVPLRTYGPAQRAYL